MDDLISRQAAIDAIYGLSDDSIAWLNCAAEAVKELPSAQPERTGRWNRLMMYLADLQLTYSPNWGANGCGDEKLYEFVTGLIEELEGWEENAGGMNNVAD